MFRILNLTKLELVVFDIYGNNYLIWILDAKIHLDVMNLKDTIKERNKTSLQDHTNTILFLHHHYHEGLKTKYLIVKDSCALCSNLKEKYHHQKKVILRLKLTINGCTCDCKNADKYMLEHIFSILHAYYMLLQQDYRGRGYKKYSKLISCFVVIKQNNKLLMKSHQCHPMDQCHSLKRMLYLLIILDLVDIEDAVVVVVVVMRRPGVDYEETYSLVVDIIHIFS